MNGFIEYAYKDLKGVDAMHRKGKEIGVYDPLTQFKNWECGSR